MAQKTVLGKGLSSLLPQVPPPAAPVETVAPQASVSQVVHANSGTGAVLAGSPEISNKDRIPGVGFATLDEIVANQYQPRRDFDDTALEELAQSIRSNGILQPLVVRKGPYGYQLIAGERRLRAAKLAGLKQVPILIRKSTDREALELALIENIQRQNLNCIDEALAYLQLMEEFHLTQEEVSERVGKERSTVANFMRLLRLPEAIIDDLKKRVLSYGHGKALLSLEDQDSRLLARKKIVEDKLSVRATETLVEQLKKGATAAQVANPAPVSAATAMSPVKSRLFNLTQELIRSLGAKVEIKGNDRRGKLVLHYSDRAELERLLEVLHTKRA